MMAFFGPRLEAHVLRLEVGALHLDRSPRCLDERGLEPPTGRTHSHGTALARALVEAGGEPGPRHEVPGRGKARHVPADLGKQDVLRRRADPGDGRQPFDDQTNGGERIGDALFDLCDGSVELGHEVEVEAQLEAMVVAHRPVQRRRQRRPRGRDPRGDQRGEARRVCLARHQRREDRPPRAAEHVREDGGELEVGVLQDLVHPLRMPGVLADELRAGPGDILSGYPADRAD
jgi:hypothetical protein